MVAGATVGLGVVAYVRRQVTRPLRQVEAAIDRLSAGDQVGYTPVDAGTPTVRRVVRAVNALTDEVTRARRTQAEWARLNAAARRVGVRIRQHVSVEPALDEGARGLAGMVGADYVVIWCGERDGYTAVGCSQRGNPSATVVADADWARHRPAERWTTDDLRSAGEAPLPADQRAALLALGAGPVVVIPFDAGPRLSGVATLGRSAAAGAWNGSEIEAVDSVLGGLGRGLLQAQLLERT